MRGGYSALVCGVTLLCGSLGCDRPFEPSPYPAPGPALIDSTIIQPGLVQRVEVHPGQPRSGDSVLFVSVITNRSALPIDVTYRICSLGLITEAELAPIGIRCAGYLAGGELAAGDSVTISDVQYLQSAVGVYPLSIVHALAPAETVDISLEVVP